MTQAAFVEALELTKVYPARGRGGWSARKEKVRAVDDVSLAIPEGATVGLVGETGSGKTTLGRMLVRLLEPTSGRILFGGRDVAHLTGASLREFRKHSQIVFQNPYSSLNPRKTVAQSVSLPFRALGGVNGSEIERRVEDLLATVGLDRALASRYPHQLSGGQRQRVVIARALALSPKFLVLDEPVSALDVSVQAQILNLLVSLQKQLGLSYLFISHDINVVGMMSDRLAVMYSGKIVETGERTTIFTRPSHPYTKALLSASRIHRSGRPSDGRPHA
jgi:ABC-type oligopeptide transport system ATPase subunit